MNFEISLEQKHTITTTSEEHLRETTVNMKPDPKWTSRLTDERSLFTTEQTSTYYKTLLIEREIFAVH